MPKLTPGWDVLVEWRTTGTIHVPGTMAANEDEARVIAERILNPNESDFQATMEESGGYFEVHQAPNWGDGDLYTIVAMLSV